MQPRSRSEARAECISLSYIFWTLLVTQSFWDQSAWDRLLEDGTPDPVLEQSTSCL
jgi:hypothetical protein